MENLKIILIWITFTIMPCLQQFLGNFLPRSRPSCRNRTADIWHIALSVELSPLFHLDKESGKLEMFMEAKWTVDFSHKNLGREIPLDGFAVHFMSVKEKRNYTIPHHSDLPTTPCISGSDHIWVKTSDNNTCDETDDSAMVQDCKEIYPEFCLCPLSNCTVLPDSLPCKGTPELLQEDQENYQTVPSTTRRLVFPITVHVKYEFAITPYYRQFANGNIVTKVETVYCDSLVQNSTANTQELRELCCLNGVQSLTAYNISVSDPRPVFKINANETTVNITVSWLPPGDGEAVKTFTLYIHGISNIIPERTAVRMKPVDIVSTVATNYSSCGIPRYSYEVELYNLQPGINYRVDIRTSFKESMFPFLCTNTHCQTGISVLAQEPAELCQEDFYLCDPSATCVEGYDKSTGRNASCTCGSGLSGDGLNISLGTGCTEIDDCLNLNDQNDCAEFAICIDLRVPDRGVQCRCGDGFHGDGKASGSGCRSDNETALAISLPIVAVLIIIAAIITWYIMRERRRKFDERFQKYIATDNGILMSHLNPNANEEKGPWEPTFGLQWEIGRKNIRFGKVLGRGNYGVVHLAWLPKDGENATGNGFAMNDAYRNGDFYNPLSSKEADEDNIVDGNSMVVAVKCLQESTHNHENLANFLEEIGFMLNIGEHENIVQIYGCTTTEEPVYLITEYLPYGDLLHFLWDAREVSKGQTNSVYKVTEESLCKMAKDVANGMAFLQQIRVIHGDIAARNILVGNEGICKLSDFGLANDVYKYGWSKGDKEKLVPFKWISPERMMSGQVPITSKSDVWSYGNLMYEMFTLGCPPYPGVQHGELLHLLTSGYRMKKPNTCSDLVYDLMNKCWRWRASSRPTFGQLLKLLDIVIYQLQSRAGIADMVTAAEELDREEYENELQNDQKRNEHVYVNCNIPAVENKCEGQPGVM